MELITQFILNRGRRTAKFDPNEATVFIRDQAQRDQPAPQAEWRHLLKSPILKPRATSRDFLVYGIPLSSSELMPQPELAEKLEEMGALAHRLSEDDEPKQRFAVCKPGDDLEGPLIYCFEKQRPARLERERGNATQGDVAAHQLLIWRGLGAEVPAGAQARRLVCDRMTLFLNELDETTLRELANAVAIFPHSGQTLCPQAVVLFEKIGNCHKYLVLAPKAFQNDENLHILLMEEDWQASEDGARQITAHFNSLFANPLAEGILATTEAGDFHILANWHGCSRISQRDPDRPSLLRTLDHKLVLFCPKSRCPPQALSRSGARLSHPSTSIA